jgi:hypothetical protein
MGEMKGGEVRLTGDSWHEGQKQKRRKVTQYSLAVSRKHVHSRFLDAAMSSKALYICLLLWASSNFREDGKQTPSLDDRSYRPFLALYAKKLTPNIAQRNSNAN